MKVVYVPMYEYDEEKQTSFIYGYNARCPAADFSEIHPQMDPLWGIAMDVGYNY